MIELTRDDLWLIHEVLQYRACSYLVNDESSTEHHTKIVELLKRVNHYLETYEGMEQEAFADRIAALEGYFNRPREVLLKRKLCTYAHLHTAPPDGVDPEEIGEFWHLSIVNDEDGLFVWGFEINEVLTKAEEWVHRRVESRSQLVENVVLHCDFSSVFLPDQEDPENFWDLWERDGDN